jgi:cell wall-associated NlpC family hydrolase
LKIVLLIYLQKKPIIIEMILISTTCAAFDVKQKEIIMTTTIGTTIFTPVFNQQNWGNIEKSGDGRVMQLETVLLPGTVVEAVTTKIDNGAQNALIEIKTSAYKSNTPLYVIPQCINEIQPTTEKETPDISTILQKLKKQKGKPYFWGSNCPDPILELKKIVPTNFLESIEEENTPFQGFDCSGLLYWASNGITPRNTSDLLSFGNKVDVTGLSVEDIQKKIRPLDLIVWQGHVIIVIDRDTVIESTQGKGVVTTPFSKRYPEATDIANKKNKNLFVRRWHPDYT